MALHVISITTVTQINVTVAAITLVITTTDAGTSSFFAKIFASGCHTDKNSQNDYSKSQKNGS
jgi:hypothetical protein